MQNFRQEDLLLESPGSASEERKPNKNWKKVGVG
ncbi:predicted protein [Botrytis cinerea T4]|uniref:Uncharacterized protein n=1 Tax=Botryotinia fuckeliana (strain T4) TaxID=999810 RepID=G2Y8Q0_BOTF4|nr:predicted protein [Botrytis cinerea T4]